MTKALVKNTIREIKNSKARFISIMAIIALGVGFFAGIKATAPSMYNLAETYFREQNLMDYRLVSTVGFDEDDIKAVSKTDGVSDVMPSYYCDVLSNSDSGADVVRLIALPKSYGDNNIINELVLKEGRFPEKRNEIVVENSTITGVKYKIGDKVVFADTAGDTDVTTEINSLEYTVVGIADSPLYISYQRGSTNVGNGKISEYMYIPHENFVYERYTELYVKADFSKNCLAFSDEYTSNSEKVSEILEKTAGVRCEVFKKDVIDKSEQELQSAKDDYSKEKQKADDEFAKAEKEINDGREELIEKTDEAQSKLNEVKNQIESGKDGLKNATDAYYTQISNAEAIINEKESELEEARGEYETAKAAFDKEISAAQQQLDEGWAEYDKSYAEFKNTQEPQLVSGIEQAQSAVDSLNNAIAAETNPEILAALNKQLLQAQQTLDSLTAQYNQAVLTFEQSKSQLDSSQSEFDSKKAEGQAQLDSALEQIEQGSAELEAAKTELETQKAEGYNQLVQAQSELDSAQSQYDDGVSELEKQKQEGQKKLDDAQKEYDDKKSETDEKFAQAQKEIDDAQSESDKLSEPKWYVFMRDDNPGYSTFSLNADKIDAVATVFPVFFLLVAVLVCVTTMTRLIEEKRTEIGTFKALGYGNFNIVFKFVIYSGIAAITGSAVGVVLGVTTLPFIIYNAYKIMYYIGDITLIINVPSVILGIAAAVVCTAAVSVIVCMRSLAHKPSSLMRPKTPKSGKRILLEYITPLWKHMSFTAKLTARNLFRYKSRLCMTVIGVAGCTALIVAAFGLLNSFDPLTKDQFETIYKYDAVVVAKDGGTKEDVDYLTEKISGYDNMSDYTFVSQEDVTVEFKENIKEDGTYLSVVQNPEELGSLISLHTRKDKKELSLTDDGVLINEKLADEFGIKTGDIIKLSSDSGNSEVKVCGIFEQYLNNYIYMPSSLYKSLYGKDAKYNMLVKLKDNSEASEEALSSQFLKDDKIAAVSFINSSLDDFRNMLNSLNLVVLVMIICAAALAFVVLYNLTNINIAERVREIATFKVLGFYNKETSSFIYKENIVLTLLGIAAGLVMGVFLTEFIVQTIEIDNIMFGRQIYFTSYLYAAGLTLLFSLLVNAVMSFKIKSVNMVESLKSVE